MKMKKLMLALMVALTIILTMGCGSDDDTVSCGCDEPGAFIDDGSDDSDSDSDSSSDESSEGTGCRRVRDRS